MSVPPSDSTQADLEERVARLERLVAALVSGRAPTVDAPTVDAPMVDAPSKPSPRAAPEPSGDIIARTGEHWLGRFGIGFVLLALALFLKLAFDRGWISPPLRVAAGYVGSIALLAFGLRLERRRPVLGQLLLGGGVAAFYLVTFVGYELYGVLSAWVAIGLMTVGTALAFVYSDRQTTPLLAIVAAVGGLATPFLIPVSEAGLGALAVYVALVLAAGGIVFLRRGWPPLLATLLVGGAVAVLSIADRAGGDGGALPLFAVISFFAVAVAAPLLRPLWGRSLVEGNEASLERSSALAAALVGSAVSIAAVANLFALERTAVGLIALGLAVAVGLLAFRFRQVPVSAGPAATLAAVALATGIALVTWNSTALPLVMAEVAVIHILVGRGAPWELRNTAHFLAGVTLAAFLGLSLAGDGPVDAVTRGTIAVSQGAWMRLLALAVAFATARAVTRETPLYAVAAYFGLLVWSAVEFSPMPNGAALVSIAWALQGAATLLLGMRLDSRLMQLAGLGTLGLVAAKMILVDLAQLDAFWRILLTLGFGIALLGLGYLINRPGTRSSPEE